MLTDDEAPSTDADDAADTVPLTETCSAPVPTPPAVAANADHPKPKAHPAKPPAAPKRWGEYFDLREPHGPIDLSANDARLRAMGHVYPDELPPVR